MAESFGSGLAWPRPAGLEACDTADLEICATPIGDSGSGVQCANTSGKSLPPGNPFSPHEFLAPRRCQHSQPRTAALRGSRYASDRVHGWRGMVARLQRRLAIMAPYPGRRPVMLRPFRPAICAVILEKESHGFTIDGTAQGLRYIDLAWLYWFAMKYPG